MAKYIDLEANVTVSLAAEIINYNNTKNKTKVESNKIDSKERIQKKDG